MSTPSLGYWRDGKALVMDRAAVLPDRCLKCNEPADGYRRKLNLQHISTREHLLLGGIAAYALAKRATIDVPLCPQHRRSSAFTIGLISFGAAIVSFAVLTRPGQTNLTVLLLAAAGLIGGVAGVLYALVGNRTLRASKITDTDIWLRGVGEPFLASAPIEPAIASDQRLRMLAGPTPAPDPSERAQRTYGGMRAGAIAFAIGGLIAVGTYLLLNGTYYIAWGPIAFGAYRLVTGARDYLALPAAFRTTEQALTLVGLIAVGIVAGGAVVFEEYEADQFTRTTQVAFASQRAGATLFSDISQRPGAWSSADASDMARVATYYGQAADVLAASTPPVTLTWYRDGLVKNFREAVDIATGLSQLTAASPQTAFDALSQRWTARVKELNALQARLKGSAAQ